jgi:hypothetical protein
MGNDMCASDVWLFVTLAFKDKNYIKNRYINKITVDTQYIVW